MAAELLVSVDRVTVIVISWCVFLMEEKKKAMMIQCSTKQSHERASSSRGAEKTRAAAALHRGWLTRCRNCSDFLVCDWMLVENGSSRNNPCVGEWRHSCDIYSRHLGSLTHQLHLPGVFYSSNNHSEPPPQIFTVARNLFHLWSCSVFLAVAQCRCTLRALQQKLFCPPQSVSPEGF